MSVKSYNKKVVISGKIIEIYEYDKCVIYGYDDIKKKDLFKGRSVSACEENKEENREKVLSRARRDLRRIINSNVNTYGVPSKFITLTFKDNITDLEYANYEFKKFIKRLNYKLGLKVAYSCVVEFQKRGAIHYHLIMYNLPYLRNKLLSEIWGNGFVKINNIDNVDNVGAYICKYMTKTDDKRLLGKKMYFNSRNLKKSIEVVESDLICAVQSSLKNQTPNYETSFKNDYNSVSYKQYIIT